MIIATILKNQNKKIHLRKLLGSGKWQEKVVGTVFSTTGV
jgi:hypothetical protein